MQGVHSPRPVYNKASKKNGKSLTNNSIKRKPQFIENDLQWIHFFTKKKEHLFITWMVKTKEVIFGIMGGW